MQLHISKPASSVHEELQCFCHCVSFWNKSIIPHSIQMWLDFLNAVWHQCPLVVWSWLWAQGQFTQVLVWGGLRPLISLIIWPGTIFTSVKQSLDLCVCFLTTLLKNYLAAFHQTCWRCRCSKGKGGTTPWKAALFALDLVKVCSLWVPFWLNF